ncbi:MAG: phospholipid carrier-dependent glycosyltransferase, partial [Patescibacteria group bacterium]|nr:phospholipid carrier-dependent glycosyltransferase [Patescibacteria group bacterium]
MNISKRFTFLFLVIIIAGAIFVRTYHYHEWLFFKWDQARDAVLLAPAIQHGPEHLPLLGPRATRVGNDYLRLGPAYYYTQYISGALFSSTKPDVFAYPDLFFSILTIPLLYFFLRLYFSRFNALLGVLLYAFSFLIIQYSRFSWNPNSVPFFTLLSFYGLLQFTKKDQSLKKKTLWLGLWALALSIASQYHFFALFSLA